MAEYTATVIESQVDWLTVSAHGGDASRRLVDLAMELADDQKNLGNRKRPWRLMGYQGHHIGAVEYGRRDYESAILRLIGDVAARELDRALSCADAVTRCDLAVTARIQPADPYLGRNAYSLAQMHYQAHPASARPWFTGDSDGGYTCYVGARDSDTFLRIYNKEAECIALADHVGAERYRACWRYELEAKASMAGALANMVVESSQRANTVLRYVHAHAEAHGIPPAFVVDHPAALVPGFRRRSDAESRIRHLTRNVKPTLDWLREAGELDRALSALGLESSNLTPTEE